MYLDPTGAGHDAIVTAVWSPVCLNLAYVSPDGDRSDNYGRQIERATSCIIWNTGGAHGNCWRYPHQTKPAEYGAALNGLIPEGHPRPAEATAG